MLFSTNQANLLIQHEGLVNQITNDINSRYASLSKQHQEFANHLNNQLQQQQQLIQQQQQALVPPPAVVQPPPLTGMCIIFLL